MFLVAMAMGRRVDAGAGGIAEGVVGGSEGAAETQIR